MTVLEPGTHPDKKLVRGRCSNCNCRVEATRGECRWQGDRDGDIYWVKCPTEGCAGGHSNGEIPCYPVPEQKYADPTPYKREFN